MSKRGLNIHKRKDGRWEGRYKKGTSNNGKILYGYVYGKSYSEVKEKLLTASANHSLETPSFSPTTNIKFRDVLNLWMEQNKVKHKGATIAKYQFIIDKHISPDIGDVFISQLTSIMINKYLVQKLESGRLDNKGGLAVSYVRTISIIINSAIQFAVNENLCSTFKSKINKPAIDKTELQILSLDAQQRLERYASRCIDIASIGVLISLNTGMRLGEVCALTWNDIDLKNKIIHVRHTVARVNSQPGSKHKTHLIIDKPKTKSSARDIPISSVLYPTLVRAKSVSVSDYVVSENKTFTSPRTLEYKYHRLLNQCNVDSINFHALRHTFATRCIEVGVDIKSLSEILGHSNVSITLETYVHSSMQLKRSQIEKLASLSA